MSGHWTVVLPYTAPPLTSNQRLHWSVKARLTKTIRRDTHHMARFLQLPTGLDAVDVVLHWQPSTVRRRDTGNLWPTLKAAVDGLVDYQLVEDDDAAHVTTGQSIEPIATVPKLWLTITDRTESTE